MGPGAPTGAGGPAQIWAVCGLLALAVGLVFAQTYRFEFIEIDDDEFVYANPHVNTGLTLAGIGWALTDGPFHEWYPLASISHMVDCQLFGLNPAAHHVINVLLHTATSTLLFLVLLRMTGDFWPSAWVAAVFAIHPLHVSSVVWVAERRELLAALFFVLTLGAYARYVERPSLAHYLLVFGLLTLGLMSKSMLVTTPFVLLLLDYWPLGRFQRRIEVPPAQRGWWLARLPGGTRLALEKIPLFALSAASCAITLSAHRLNPMNAELDPLSFSTRVANALVASAAYVVQSFCPVGLSPYYPHLGTHLPTAQVAEAAALLVAISALAVYWWRQPYVLVGWLWFVGMLVPTLGLVGSFIQGRADNYTYLPQIGLSIALAWPVWSVFQAWKVRQRSRWPAWVLSVASGAAVLLLAAVAWRQAWYWRNTEAVWTRAVGCSAKLGGPRGPWVDLCAARKDRRGDRRVARSRWPPTRSVG